MSNNWHSVTPTAFTGGYSNIKLRQHNEFHSSSIDTDVPPHPNQYSPVSAHNSIPPAPLPEDNGASMSGNNGGGGGDFDLSDEQAEQLLRELDLLGAQLQIMDHETRMLGTKTGNKMQSSLTNSSSNGTTPALGQQYRGNSVTPYRMQLTEQTTETRLPWDTQSFIDLGHDGNVEDGSEDDATGRSCSVGRTSRKQRALFVPRKPTTAEALMAVDASSMPVNPLELEPLELASEPSNNPLSPKRWVNSVSRFLNRRNSVSGTSQFMDLSSSSGVLERSRTTGATKPRPQSLMMFSAGSRRKNPIIAASVEQQPTRVDINTLTNRSKSNTTNTASSSGSSNISASPIPSSTTPKAETAPKPRRARPYSMGFFTRSNTSDKLINTINNKNNNKNNNNSRASADDDTLLRRLDALNQELSANPKSVRLHNDSIQAGTAALFSLTRCRLQSRNAFSTNNARSQHGGIAEENDADHCDGNDSQNVILNAGGAPNHARSMSASVYTVG